MVPNEQMDRKFATLHQVDAKWVCFLQGPNFHVRPSRCHRLSSLAPYLHASCHSRVRRSASAWRLGFCRSTQIYSQWHRLVLVMFYVPSVFGCCTCETPCVAERASKCDQELGLQLFSFAQFMIAAACTRGSQLRSVCAGIQSTMVEGGRG